MEIQDYCPTFKEGQDLSSVLICAALAAKWQEVRRQRQRRRQPAPPAAAARPILAGPSHLHRVPACLATPRPHPSLSPTSPAPTRSHPPSSPAPQPPKDALDTMVLGAVDLPGLDKYTLIDHQPFDPTIKRTEGVSGRPPPCLRGNCPVLLCVKPATATVQSTAPLLAVHMKAADGPAQPASRPAHLVAPSSLLPLLAQHVRGPDGVEFKTTKGAPQIIAKLCNADNIPELKMRVEAEVANLGARGIRSLAVARTKEGSLDEWEMLGMLTFLDPPRPDTKHTIEQVGRGTCGGMPRRLCMHAVVCLHVPALNTASPLVVNKHFTPAHAPHRPPTLHPTPPPGRPWRTAWT